VEQNRRRNTKRYWTLGFIALALSSCASTVPIPPLSEIKMVSEAYKRLPRKEDI